MMRMLCGILASAMAAISFPLQAETLEIYIDADYSISAEAAQSIELGITTALAQHGNRLGGEDVVVTPIDHQGNVKRSQRTMRRYLESETAIAIFGGLHSPPYLANQSFINESEILTLLPWSAAGPITRAAPGETNWFFRLSVDDFKSGGFLVEQVRSAGGCGRTALILLDTGWGRANYATLSAALNEHSMQLAAVEFFPVTIGAASAGTLADNIARARADCAILLSNWDSGARIASALEERVPGLRVFSHWGIMGGEFAQSVPHKTRENLQILVLQTCGLRREQERNPVLAAALKDASQEFEELSDVSAPTGFVHGYDLATLLIHAADQAASTPEWQGSIKDRRRAIREALVALETPVDGILMRYVRPFGAYSPENPDAHEALGRDDLCMARFRRDGRLEDAG